MAVPAPIPGTDAGEGRAYTVNSAHLWYTERVIFRRAHAWFDLLTQYPDVVLELWLGMDGRSLLILISVAFWFSIVSVIVLSFVALVSPPEKRVKRVTIGTAVGTAVAVLYPFIV